MTNKYVEVEIEGKKGLLHKNGTEFLPCKYDELDSYQFNDDKNKYYEVEIDGKKGLLHKNGTEFLPCKYDKLATFQLNDGKYKYVDVEIEGKKGLLNKNGTEFLPCKYDELSSYQFNDDKYKYVDVEIDDKKGLLNKNGKEMLPCKYDELLKNPELYDDFFCVEINGKKGLLYEDGREFLPCKYDFVFKEGNYFSTVNYGADPHDKFKGSKHGLVDTKGKELLPCIYDFIDIKGFAKMGFAEVKKNNYYGTVDLNCKEIIPCKYISLDCSYYKEKNIILVVDGILTPEKDKKGNPIRKDAKWGAVDGKGNIIIPIEYSYRESFPYGLWEDLFVCEKDGKYGFLDCKGNVVIPFIYDYADAFRDGVAQVRKDGVTSLITHPLKGTKLNVANGGVNTVKVDNNIPEVKQVKENTFAFIFANENYAHFKEADYAINDGQVFGKYCKKTLGIPETNMKYYEDATYGNIVSAVKRIQDIADAYDGDASIIFYFSGLGAIDSKTRERYLLPSDASFTSLHSTGYSLNTLQQTLESLKTTYTLVILDAPFNNTDRSGKQLSQNRGVAIAAKPMKAKGNVIIWTGSKEGETAYSNKKYGHGLLTYALLEKLQSSKGMCGIKELTESASSWVRKETVKSQNKMQSPQTEVSEEMVGKWLNLKF